MVVGAQGGPAGGSSSQRPGHTNLGGAGSPAQAVVGAQGGPAGGNSSLRAAYTCRGGSGVLPRWWSVLMEGPRGVAAPIGLGTPARAGGESYAGGGWCSRRACEGYQFPMARAHQPGQTGSPAQVVLKEGLRGVAVPNGPGKPSQRDVEYCPGGGRCSRKACGGQQPPKGLGTPAWGDGNSYPGGGRCSGRPVGGSSSQWPGHFNPGGRRVLPWWWSVLKEGLWGVAVPNGPGTPARGDGESCRGGGRCSRRACGGLQFPTAQAHQPRGTGRLAQVVVGAQEGPVGGSSSQWPGHTRPGGRGDRPRWWSALKERLRGVAVPNGPGTPFLGGREVLPRWWSVLKAGLWGVAVG